MESIVHCLLSNCFDGKGDEDEDSSNYSDSDGDFIVSHTTGPLSLDRGGLSLYTPPPGNSSIVEREGDNVCNDHRQWDPLNHSVEESLDDTEVREREFSIATSSNHFGIIPPRVYGFVHRVRQGLHDAQTHFGWVPNYEMEGMLKRNGPLVVMTSPLRVANKFTRRPSSGNIPSIAQEEVVLPGSELQQEMSDSLQKKGYGVELAEDECVICMEGFDKTNPRMPTHCGCGDNKTYFHLPCLYQWVEQSDGQNRNCPSCRQRLVWQEFE